MLPRRDAPLVAQLRAAGAVILGKANLSELAGVVTMAGRFGGTSAVGGRAMNPFWRAAAHRRLQLRARRWARRRCWPW